MAAHPHRRRPESVREPRAHCFGSTEIVPIGTAVQQIWDRIAPPPEISALLPTTGGLFVAPQRPDRVNQTATDRLPQGWCWPSKQKADNHANSRRPCSGRYSRRSVGPLAGYPGGCFENSDKPSRAGDRQG